MKNKMLKMIAVLVLLGLVVISISVYSEDTQVPHVPEAELSGIKLGESLESACQKLDVIISENKDFFYGGPNKMYKGEDSCKLGFPWSDIGVKAVNNVVVDITLPLAYFYKTNIPEFKVVVQQYLDGNNAIVKSIDIKSWQQGNRILNVAQGKNNLNQSVYIDDSLISIAQAESTSF